MNAITLLEFPKIAASSGHLFARHFSSFIVKKSVSGDNSGYLEALACLLVYLQSDGLVCIDLQRNPIIQTGDAYREVRMPSLEVLVRDLAIHKGDVVGSFDDPGQAPLILHHGRYLYLQRYWHYEQQVIGKIEEMMSTSHRLKKPSRKCAFNDGGMEARQVQAVTKALTSQLSIIAGGPGTGKTTIAVRIIAANLLADSDMEIALAAPTGKAAARMKESIGQNIGAMALDREIKNKVSHLETYTLHRLLGARYNSPYFRHDSSKPLPHDLLIIDESSMIDLPMMAKLLDAVGKNTSLVLIGDPNQLPPVEVGSVFGQIVHNSSYVEFVTTLEQNFRAKEAPHIIKLCEQVNAGDADGALTLLKARSDQVVWKKIDSNKDTEWIVKEGAERYGNLLKQNNPDKSILNISRKFRILTALRRGPFGADSINARIKSQLNTDRELLLVTHNDPENRIFNGDIGTKVILDDEELIWIEGKDHPISPLRIPEYQLAYAMTGHKAQGSEFDHVHLLLPTDRNCPLLTREWLYTSVSRAKKSVTIWADEAALRKCLTTRVERSSGIFHTKLRPK